MECLNLYYAREDRPAALGQVYIPGQEDEVEQLLHRKQLRTHYLVRRKGKPPVENFKLLEPVEQLTDCAK